MLTAWQELAYLFCVCKATLIAGGINVYAWRYQHTTGTKAFIAFVTVLA